MRVPLVYPKTSLLGVKMGGRIIVKRVGDGPLWSVGSTYYSPAVVEHAKAVPGMVYDNPTHAWHGYADAVTAVVARLATKNIRCVGADELPDPESWRTSRTPYLFATSGAPGYRLRDYQVEGVRFIIAKAREGALLGDGMRLGKMQAVTEPVLTPTGWRPIGDLRVGDTVIGSNGRTIRITGVFPNGRKDIFRVTLTDGAWTLCGAEHLWSVQTPKDKYAGRPHRTLELSEIRKLGLVQPGTTNRRWFVPIADPSEFSLQGAPPLDPYVLGALIANGSMLGRVTVHTGGDDQRRQMRPLLPIGSYFAKKNRYARRLQPAAIVREPLKALGLWDKRSWEKSVPREYLLGTPSNRLSLIQGLFDNDGTVSRDGLTVEYNTTSPQLADDVLFLIRSLGGIAWMSTRIPTYTHKGKKLKGRRDHRIRVSLPPHVIPFRLPRKRNLFRPRSKFQPCHAIDKIERAGQAECVCISVEASDGLYVTRDFIVTHNSAQATVAARAFKGKTLVICPSHVVGVWGRPKAAPEGPGEIAKWWPDAWRGAPVEGDLTEREGSPAEDPERPGVMCLETVKPFAAQTVARKLSAKKKLTPEEESLLVAAQVEMESRAKALENVQVIVCHYDIIYAWVDVLRLWGVATLICDELHIAAGWQSRRSEALKELSEASARRIGLTGTLITNKPRNLHNVLEILAPNRFGYFFTGARPGCFSRLFCGSFQKTVGSGAEMKTVWDHSGSSNLDKPDGKYALTQEETLKARLKFLMIRRLKKDVDPQLPQKVRQIVDVSIPARHVIKVSASMLSPGGGELRRCLDLAADGKLKSVVALVEGHIAEDEKVICFCYRRLFAERVAEDIENDSTSDVMVKFVHGGLSQKERDRRIHALREHKGPGVLACTIDTTSTGIDLSFANVAVVGELTWEYHELQQLEERLYAFGANTKALIQYVIARGTGDELVLRGVINKLDISEKLIGETGDQMKEELSKKKEDGMGRLFKALAEMQKGTGEMSLGGAASAPVTKPRRRIKKGAP